jgi:hypothetical protein
MPLLQTIAHSLEFLRLFQSPANSSNDLVQSVDRLTKTLKEVTPGGGAFAASAKRLKDSVANIKQIGARDRQPNAGFVEKSANAYERDIPVGMVESQLDPNEVPGSQQPRHKVKKSVDAIGTQKPGESEEEWLRRLSGPKFPTPKFKRDVAISNITGARRKDEPEADWLQRIGSPEGGSPFGARSPFAGGGAGEIAGSPFAGGGAGSAGGAAASLAAVAKIGGVWLAAGVAIEQIISSLREFAKATNETAREMGKFSAGAAIASAQQDAQRQRMAWQRASAAEPFSMAAIQSRTEMEQAWQPVLQLTDKLSSIMTVGINHTEKVLLEIVANTEYIRHINALIKWLIPSLGAASDGTPFMSFLDKMRRADAAPGLGEDWKGGERHTGQPRGPQGRKADQDAGKVPAPQAAPTGAGGKAPPTPPVTPGSVLGAVGAAIGWGLGPQKIGAALGKAAGEKIVGASGAKK